MRSCSSLFSAICRFPTRVTAATKPDATVTTVANPGPGAMSRPASESPPALLEELPFEIQHLILSQAPTFDTLRALVHASPRLHSVYIQDRLPLLRNVTEQAFDGFLIDAHMAYLSGTDEFQQSRTEPMLWEFVETYRQRLTRTSAPSDSAAAQLSLEDIVQLARFHKSVIEPLTDRYATWALAALSSSPASYPLSGAERRRIQRALYHFQVFCNLCGSRGEGRSTPVHIRDPVDRLRILCLFPAWQIEEILCINAFAWDVYGAAFYEVAWDLDEERNPKYRHIDMTSVQEDLLLFLSPDIYINEGSLEAMLRHGLTLLSSVTQTTDHEELGDHRDSIFGDWIDDALDYTNQDTRRENWFSEEDAAQDRRDKMPFRTDTPYLPPLAWVTIWRGEASNLFGPYVPRTFRRWGYVMWDAPRLESSGAMKYMELEDRVRHEDPREFYREDSDS
ncbi:hypothetical protein B0I37DRAFT_381771 [Chaetomium sp. MPI-CAGE-AT-0009]|nr:hypothetical protein B0I37DRAFT_381771 [Chaetomium sp. MPI-CAGE-AT-0009]